MTADIELLPLPDKVEVDKHLPTGVRIYAYDATTLKNYARANVEHHTAPLQAEIEALRVEVRDLRRRQAGWGRHIAAAGCEYVREGEHDALVNRRAERLAEALRELLIDMMLAQSAMRRAAKTDPRWEGCAEAIQPRVDSARAALRDHDKEGGDG